MTYSRALAGYTRSSVEGWLAYVDGRLRQRLASREALLEALEQENASLANRIAESQAASARVALVARVNALRCQCEAILADAPKEVM